MSNYRTSSLFHYTKSLDSLIKILESGALYPNYSLEDLSTKNNPDNIWGIPEICFCDIPITKADLFLEQYGSYAIAFDKKWGIQNGCNPIQYVQNEEIIDAAIYNERRIRELKTKIQQFKDSMNYRATVIEKMNEIGHLIQDYNTHTYTLGFLKKYMGIWKDIDYCNYDENEWRYVIPDGRNDIHWLSKEGYSDWRGPVCASSATGQGVTTQKPEPTEELKNEGLLFSHQNIHHILVKSESDIQPLIDKLFGQKRIGDIPLIEKEMAFTITRISSFERIKKDF